MNRKLIGTIFLSLIIMHTTAQATPGYLGTSISEFDLLGCHNNSKNPRCKKIVKVACKTICFGRENEDGELSKACKDMCKLPLKVEPAKEEKKKTGTLNQ